MDVYIKQASRTILQVQITLKTQNHCLSWFSWTLDWNARYMFFEEHERLPSQSLHDDSWLETSSIRGFYVQQGWEALGHFQIFVQPLNLLPSAQTLDGFQLLLDVLQYCNQAFSYFCECDELWYFFLVSMEDYGYVYPLDQGQRNDTVFWCIQGDSTSAYLIADSVWSTADFFGYFVSWPSIFQANLNQNSLIIRKVFPFFVFSCGRIYMIHSDNSFGWLLIWHLHSTTEVSLWIFYLIVQLDYTINLSFLFPKITKLLSLIPKISVILALEHISFLLFLIVVI